MLKKGRDLEEWEEYYVEDWMNMHEWVKKQKEKGERMRVRERKR